MEHFLANICTSEWNAQQDAGRSFAEACTVLKLDHPQYADAIDAWFQRQPEMIAGPIEGTVEILRELRDHGIPVYAPQQLVRGNFSAFPQALRFSSLVSGHRAIGRSQN